MSPHKDQWSEESELSSKANKMVHWDDYKIFNIKCMTINGAKEWIAAGNEAREKGYDVPNERLEHFRQEAIRNGSRE